MLNEETKDRYERGERENGRCFRNILLLAIGCIGWNRIMDMFTPFAFNLLGIPVYTAILLPKSPGVLPVFAVMSVMNILLERKYL